MGKNKSQAFFLDGKINRFYNNGIAARERDYSGSPTITRRLMKKTVNLIFYILVAALLAIAAYTSSSGNEFLSPSGIWSVLPPLIAILLAFLTKNVVVSLLIGVLSATFLLALKDSSAGIAVFESFDLATRYMCKSVAKPWNAGVLLQTGAIGGLVGIITASGGIRAVAEALAKLARGPRSAQVISWFLGFFIFFDDYANVQIRGPIMRPIADNNGVSREKFSFILDSTSAPIAGMALISTWIGTEVSYISAGLEDAGLASTITPYGLFVESIPFRFYNVLTLAFVLISALTLREFGPMRHAEVLARRGFLREMDSRLIRREEAAAQGLEEAPAPAASSSSNQGVVDCEDDGKDDFGASQMKKPESLLRSSMYAIVPLLSLVITSFVFFYYSGLSKILGGETNVDLSVVEGDFSFAAFRACIGEADASVAIFQAGAFASIVAFIMSVMTHKLTADEAVRSWLSGVKSLAFTFVILILAWSLSASISKDGLGTANFLVTSLSSGTPTFILPTFIFVLAAIVSFATGTSYGTMAIITPLAIPFANEILPGNHAYLVAATSAVLTGAIFGDHCSPISDTTILSANSARCGLLEHVSTQLSYALWIAGISIVLGFLPVGLGVSLSISLPVALAAVFALIFIVGRKVPVTIPDDEQ